MTRKHFRVWAIPEAMDENTDHTHIAVQGPRMDEIAVMHDVAARIERALNSKAPVFTAAELNAISAALGFALAGETDDWPSTTVAAMRRAHSKLGA
jgi:hypothetical protein